MVARRRENFAATTPRRDWEDMTTTESLANHNERLLAIEVAIEQINDLGEILKKIARYIKIWGPIIATAAVSSGVASGRWGAFISALFTGQP